MALHYLYGAMTITCSSAAINSWTCGNACKNLPGFSAYFLYRDTVEIDGHTDPVAFDIIVNTQTKEVIYAFRGTDSNSQMQDEFTHFLGITYTTENFIVPGALVDNYFAELYTNYFHQKVITNLQKLGQLYPDFVYTFTGHSLGGSMATLAALDGATSGLIPVSQKSPQLYTFGSPRVGNWVFAQAVSSLVPVMFRIVHFNDLVPHVPLCQGEPASKCQNNNYGAAPIWAWHVKQEIFYNKDNSSYKVCSETNSEDWSCSDSLSYVVWSAHDFYLGLNLEVQCE